MAAVALMVKSVEFYLANAARQFAGGSKRTGGKRGDDGDVHHIHIATPDPEKARAWYVKTFGAREGTRGNFLAAFIPGGEVDFRKAQEAPAPTKGRSLDHIGFEVKGLEALCKKLQAEGMTLEMAYREVPQLDGLKIAFLIDPEGTRIELTEGLAGR